MKVCFETFGCRLNRAETLNMEALFLANGWTKTTGHSDADLIIVRGCSVTRRAQRGTEKFIAGLRAKYPAKRIFTVGCITDRTPEAMIENAMRAARRDGTFVDSAVPTSTARAYLKVQDGCSGKCSYCIVPKFRGASVSEDFDRVMDNARRFLDCGYTEIVLTGCNLSLYLSKGRRLADLLSALAGIGGAGHRIRLGSLEPGPAAAEAIDALTDFFGLRAEVFVVVKAYFLVNHIYFPSLPDIYAFHIHTFNKYITKREKKQAKSINICLLFQKKYAIILIERNFWRKSSYDPRRKTHQSNGLYP